MSTDPAIRPLTTQADLEACTALQRATWGDDFRELVPPAMLTIAGKVGGICAGAFHDGRLVGFVYGLTGVRDGRLVHWSHMLAVAESHRDRGIGRRLKAWQREQVRALGVDRMYWTFDPLVARNARLNLAVLGARVVSYEENMYGENPMSRTDSVIGSDRFVVRWVLDPSLGDGMRRGGEEGMPNLDGRVPVVTPERPAVPAEREYAVAIPQDIQALKREEPEAARAWREVHRAALGSVLVAGGRVRELAERPDGGVAYLVTRDG